MSNLNRHPVRRTAAGVLAGALAFSGLVAAGTPANAAAGFQLNRIAGADRYETSAQTVAAFDAAVAVTNVILASGENGRAADALGASFLAGVRGAPVLLTPQAGLAASTRTALQSLRTNGATSVTIVGGPTAVSANVEAQVTALGFTVNRLGGADRFRTAELVATAGEATAAGNTGAASNVGIVASGISTVDALAVGPLAYKGRHPIFLTRAAALPATTIAAMRANGVTSVYIVGGETVVSAAVRSQLTAAGITVVDRLAGQTRSATSVAIANAIIGGAFGFTNTTFNVASGARDGVDALSGAALSGQQNRALLITETADNAGAIIGFATARAATLNAPGIIFGGPAAITPAVETAIETAGGAVFPVALASATVAQGGNLTGTITGDFSSVTVSGCGFTNQTVGADDNATTAGRQFTLNVPSGQAVGNCDVTFTFTPTGGGAAFTQVVTVAVTASTVTSATTRPELRTAAIVSTTATGQANADNPLGTVVRYTFDENVLSADFNDYQLVGSNGTDVATATALVSVSGNTVSVRFGTVNTTTGSTAANVNNYTLATVLAGAATDAQGEQSPEGDASIGTAGSTTSTAVANTTSAPDLRSVSGFRAANVDPNVGGGVNSTAVDFVFDQAAFVTGSASFHLVRPTGQIIDCVEPPVSSTRAGGGTVSGGNGTTTITVICPNIGTTTLVAADIARGYVAASSVADTQANATSPGTNDNPLQSAAVTNNGVTTTVDLVSAQFVAANSTGNTTSNDQVLYTFDQETPTAFDEGVFRVFFANGDSATGTVGAGARSTDGLRVLVTFAGTQLTDAVGASVGTQTTGGTSVTILPASVGVAPVRSGTSSRTPGQVDAPELRSVAITTSTNALNVVSTTATYTFDQAINPNTIVANRFRLYNADGNALTGVTCAAPANATATNTQVACTLFSQAGAVTAPATIQTIAASATLGTVLPGAVTGATGSANVNPNPAGAEFTTGGTGTRA